jgi:hypothetical protein
MDNSMFSPKPIVAVRAVYEAEIQWYWADSHVHDQDYHNKVNDAVDAEIKRVCDPSPTLYQDTRYCCQWEGIKLIGESLEQVRQAGEQVAKVLGRYKFLLHFE